MSAEAERKTEQVPEWKREEVAEIASIVESYDSIGVVDITGIPSRQLQEMRRDLHGSAELRVSRNTLLQRALADVEGSYEQLTEFVEGHVGLIGTDDNPFGLYQQMEASKTPAPINAGEIAPNDIVIPEGDTGVDPGPFVGELQQVGAAAQIMEGSIQVTEDSTVLEEGEEVSDDLANVLSELGIEPKEVGLDLRGVVADGVLFEPEDLELDVEAYRSDVSTAAARARNLAVNAVVPTAETTPTLVAKATGEAKSVGLQAAIESPDLADDLVRKADAQVRALAGRVDDDEALPDELADIEPLEDEATDDEGADESADAETADEDDEESTDDQPAEDAADDADDDDDDDDEDAAAEGLGDMFG